MLHIRNFLYILSVIALLFSINAAYSDEEVNLYSARKEHLIRPIIDLFEKRTNIK